MRWLLVLAACSSNGPDPFTSWSTERASVGSGRAANPASAPTPVPPLDAGVVAPEPLTGGTTTAPPETVPVSGRVVTSLHGTAIAIIAVTDDARAALTVDFAGSVRLWPSLDGKREPVVVEMRAPSAIALGAWRDELVAAGLDGAGQIELVTLSKAGEAVNRWRIDTARPLLSIHATASGFIALRDDHAIIKVALDDNSVHELVAEPGEHIVTITVRNDRTLALIDRDGEVVGRWVEPTPLQWGAYTAALPIRAERVALSPDGKRVAGLAQRGDALAIVDLETGRVLARPLKGATRERIQPIGFVSNAVVAVGTTLQWVHWQDGIVTTTEIVSEFDGRSAFVASNGRVIAGLGAALAIARPDEDPQFVGYRMGGPVSVRWFGDHYVVTDSAAVIELDRRFRTRLIHELPQVDGSTDFWHRIHILDAKHIIGMTHSSKRRGYSPFLVDLSAGEATPVECAPLEYEPSTSLVACSGRDDLELREFDSASATLGSPFLLSELEPVAANSHIKLLDPRRTGSHVAALAIDDNFDGVAELSMIRRAAPGRFEITEQRIVKHDPGSWLLFLRNRFAPTVRDPSGRLTAVLRDARITLRDADGNERWTVPAAGADGLVWTRSGDLVAYGQGMARLDVATGAFVDRQCGWRFGLWDKQPFAGGAALCEAP